MGGLLALVGDRREKAASSLEKTTEENPERAEKGSPSWEDWERHGEEKQICSPCGKVGLG